MSTDRIPLKVLFAIIGTVLAWSSAFVVIRAVLPVFEPGELAFLRQLVAVPLLAVWMIGQKWLWPTVREWVLIAIFGLTWFSIYIVALNTAEQTIDAGTASFVVNIGPLLIAVGAFMFLGEKLSRNLIPGALIALAGVGLIAWGTSSSDRVDLVGVLWALVATVTYAVGVLTQKPALKRLSSNQVTLLGAAIALIPLFWWAPEAITTVQSAPIDAIVGAVWLGAIPTALGFGLWGYALKRMPAGRLGVSTYVVPPLVIVESAILLGEWPHPIAIVGGLIALAGVWWSRRS
ncbi:MAG: DMT family transporter [Microbacteriaceae bacterium]|nr:DMT family transporter [Microbacteriaceae bacterium]